MKLFFIITTGSKHYALYQCFGIKNRKHIYNLNIQDYGNRVYAKIEFKNLLRALHGTDNFFIDFKG